MLKQINLKTTDGSWWRYPNKQGIEDRQQFLRKWRKTMATDELILVYSLNAIAGETFVNDVGNIYIQKNNVVAIEFIETED